MRCGSVVFLRSASRAIPNPTTTNHSKTKTKTGLQRLVIGTTQLEEGTLYPMVKEADTVTLLMGIDGGMRAKWRKKRMRRLRRKRRKMRQRAR